MTDGTAQAEQVQHTFYLDKNRNWAQEVDSPFYHNKVFFMKDGRVGMEVSGRVFVKSIELWASLALSEGQDA